MNTVILLAMLVATAMVAPLAPVADAFVALPPSTTTAGARTSRVTGSSLFVRNRPLFRPSPPAACTASRSRGAASATMVSATGSLPEKLVLNDGERQKLNVGADAFFYNYPRICYHVDQGFLTHLTTLYGERISPGGAVLDMMSSWVSHLPPDVTYSRVDGQGMNLEELNRNPRLDTKRVWDLNAEPRLPFDDGTYDAVICAVSVQYLQQPEKVFADVRRVLKPGGVAIFSFSNRMFSDKAIKAWIDRSGKGRTKLVSEYFKAAGGFSPPESVERAGQDGAGFFSAFADMFGMVGTGDPFYAVVATKEA